MRTIKELITAVILSVLIAITCFIFGEGLLLMSKYAFKLFPYNLIVLPLVGIMIIYVRKKYDEQLNGSMVKVFDSTKYERDLSLLIVPFQIVFTWLSHLSGASVGREGVALQLGATISNNIATLLKQDSILFSTAGKAAGFAALFGTPLAATAFVFERNREKLSNKTFIAITILMTFLSSKLTEILGLEHFKNKIEITLNLSLFNVMLLILFTIMSIFVAGFFVKLLKFQKEFYAKKIKNEYIKIIILSIIYILVMFLLNGKYMSLGTNLIDMSFNNPELITNYDFIIKLLLTTYIISIGYQGGEVTPLFSIGATFGVVFGTLFGLPIALMAALGYALIFGNATNSYYAAFFIALEVFGLKVFPYILIVTIVNILYNKESNIYPIYK